MAYNGSKVKIRFPIHYQIVHCQIIFDSSIDNAFLWYTKILKCRYQFGNIRVQILQTYNPNSMDASDRNGKEEQNY